VVAYLPLALKEGQPLRGRVRQEFNLMAEGILSMGVSTGAERSQDVQPYPVLDRSTATLTMREYESDPLVIHLHTEGDYWVRHVSLTHTDPRDGSDVEIPEKVGICCSRTELSSHVEHIRAGRTAQDLLYEILLKSGFPLTTPVEPLQLAGKTVYSVADGVLFLCLEQALTLDVIRAMAEHKPERVVCLDAGFAGNDQLKANAAQIFKTRGVTSFKTV
jgi:hypothetical protein